MRRALIATPATIQTVETETIPAPTGGWNALDSLANMPLTDAVRMDNWFPEATYVRSRPGVDTHFSALGGQVETLFAYAGANTLELLVAESGNIWNGTTAGSASAGNLLASAFANNRWQYTNFTTPGGNFMAAVNGQDAPQFYDGSAFSAMSVNFLSGTAADMINVHAYAERLFFIEKNTLSYHYMDSVQTIAGSAKKVDLGSVFNLGGYLIAQGSWTRDGGSGMDDATVFLTSEGEAAVYTGLDPGDANSWSLLGVYRMPAPLGRRCMQKFGGDLLILTEGGVYPLSLVLSGVEPQSLITYKIHPAVAEAVSLYRSNYGWQLKYYPTSHWLVINVPVKTGEKQEQYIMNTETGAWCRFTGISANVFECYDSKIYYGANGAVIQADKGTADDGTAINMDVKQAFSNFGYSGFKTFPFIKPFINSDNDLAIAIGLNTDFGDRSPVSTPTASNQNLPYWGQATWSNPSYNWAGKPIPQGRRQTGGASGIYAAMRMKGQVRNTLLQWNATQVGWQRGSI